MKRKTGSLIFVILCYAAAGGMWYWYLMQRPLEESDFVTITGTLKSAEEKGSREPFLEFYIVERPVRFRVPVDGYRELFNREAFFANVRPGMKINITAEKAQLDKPLRPVLDPVDTVFADGLKDDRMAYCTLGGRKDWEQKNRLYGLILAIVLSVAAIGLTWRHTRPAPETFGAEPPMGASQERRSGHTMLEWYSIDRKMAVVDRGVATKEDAMRIIDGYFAGLKPTYEYVEEAIAETMFGFRRSKDEFIELGISSPEEISFIYEISVPRKILFLSFPKIMQAEKWLHSKEEVKSEVSLFYDLDSASFQQYLGISVPRPPSLSSH